MHFTGKLKKKDGKLIYTSLITEKKFDVFRKSLNENSVVHVFMEADSSDGRLDQLAKIHAMIRELSNYTGQSVKDLKLLVKYNVGLCITRNIQGKELCECESFGDCSAKKLSLVIEEITRMGTELGIIWP